MLFRIFAFRETGRYQSVSVSVVLLTGSGNELSRRPLRRLDTEADQRLAQQMFRRIGEHETHGPQ